MITIPKNSQPFRWVKHLLIHPEGELWPTNGPRLASFEHVYSSSSTLAGKGGWMAMAWMVSASWLPASPKASISLTSCCICAFCTVHRGSDLRTWSHLLFGHILEIMATWKTAQMVFIGGIHQRHQRKLGIVPIAGKLDMAYDSVCSTQRFFGHGDNFGGCTHRKIRET